MPLIFTCPPAPISCWGYISNKHSTRMNDVYKCTLVPSGNSSLPTTCRPDTVTMSSGPARCSDSISVIGITIFPNFNRIFSCLGRHSEFFVIIDFFSRWCPLFSPSSSSFVFREVFCLPRHCCVMATPFLIKSSLSSGVVIRYVKS